MKKRNGNFEYFKPQNGGSLAASGTESTNSNDSDSKEMFSLPKRKVIRPRKLSARKTRKCCRVCLAASLPLIMAILIVGICSSMVFVLLGISGLQREVQLLKVGLKQVESTDHSNLKESSRLQISVKEQLKKMKADEEKLAEVNKKLEILNEKVNRINITVVELAKSMQKKTSFNSVVQDVDQLKKGMADTFNSIKRLEDDSGKIKGNVGIFSKMIKEVRVEVTNLTRDVLILKAGTHHTQKSSSHGNRPSPKISTILEKILDGYENRMTNKTHTIAKVLKNHEIKLENFDDRIKKVENRSSSHHRQLELLKKISVLLTAEVRAYKNASDGKLNEILKLILNDLSRRNGNLTADLLAMKHTVPKAVQTLITRYVELSKSRSAQQPPTTPLPETTSTQAEQTATGLVGLTTSMPSLNETTPRGPPTTDAATVDVASVPLPSSSSKQNNTINPSSSSNLPFGVTPTSSAITQSSSLPYVNSTGEPMTNPTDTSSPTPKEHIAEPSDVVDKGETGGVEGDVDKREDLSVSPPDELPNDKKRVASHTSRLDSFQGLTAGRKRSERLFPMKKLLELAHRKRESDSMGKKPDSMFSNSFGSPRSGRSRHGFIDKDERERNYNDDEEDAMREKKSHNGMSFDRGEPNEDKDLYELDKKGGRSSVHRNLNGEGDYSLDGGSEMGDTRSLEALDIAETGKLGRR